MVVEDVHAKHPKAGPLSVKVDFDRIMPCRDHPEYVVPVDMHVVVVDLLIHWPMRVLMMAESRCAAKRFDRVSPKCYKTSI
jgi:hypothetical protein